MCVCSSVLNTWREAVPSALLCKLCVCVCEVWVYTSLRGACSACYSALALYDSYLSTGCLSQLPEIIHVVVNDYMPRLQGSEARFLRMYLPGL